MLAAGEPFRSRAESIRIACVLEATAAKVGNVHPGASFDDLAFDDFVKAADCTAEAMGGLRSLDQFGPSILKAIRSTRHATGTNVNLGIVLLLGPLLLGQPDTECAGDGPWRHGVAEALARLTPEHGGYVAAAIVEASAGGMDTSEVDDDDPLNLLNVEATDSTPAPYDLMDAMRRSASRDRIALQYATGFEDLFENVVPTLRRSIDETGDRLDGIVLAHVRLIAAAGDSLIARKCGDDQSRRIQGLARRCLDNYGPDSIAELDRQLRDPGHRFNPGTTADLIAAGLYVCLSDR
ncbi:triphosphoribosyl-dephospho-CoA synthase [Neorhodopirellula pilleata]|uniref:ATP:dephospho-CoA triphosphoribosyl transferase n=1 Tax=Neorhodopirellula pilleata TaxID=2714738 RepID=A0A5C6AHQ6_9BACT|nr:triphosphoribosyl-dephospho-CoA synthase [Neorhodopirellula pilleata]TWT98725.1 ATP:dephospho-CoA triphosphoribosyl transferase [Neorhodopirellula pilleata]